MLKSVVNSTSLLKQTNVTSISNKLRELGEATISDLASETGLSTTTCNKVLKELIENGEAIQGSTAPSTGGRPAKIFRYNPGYSLVLGISITTNKNIHTLDCGLSTITGNIKERKSLEYQTLTFDILDKLITSFFNEYNNISGIGIGIPGMVHNGVITYCDVEPLNGLKLQHTLEKQYNADVLVEREMNCKVYGYYLEHPEISKDYVAILNAPKGHIVGAGFMLRGKILTGNYNFAGEVSYCDAKYSPEQQLKSENDDLLFTQWIANLLDTITPIINPKYVLLAGKRFSSSIVDNVKQQYGKYVQPDIAPEILYKQDLSDEYLNGIINLMINDSAPNILVEQVKDIAI